MHNSCEHTSSTDWKKLRLRVSMPSSIACLRSRIKISVNTDISVIGFYENIGNIGNIGKISMDIFTKISVIKFFFSYFNYIDYEK